MKEGVTGLGSDQARRNLLPFGDLVESNKESNKRHFKSSSTKREVI